MKKITTLATIACLGMTTLVAQTQRTILYEEFTGENCPPCASTNPYVDAAINPNMPNKIILLRYQCNIPSAPGAGSLYQDNTSEVATRQTYYSVPFAPYARFNGIELADVSGGGNNGHAILIDPTYYPNIINDSAIVNAPFGITATHAFNSAADSVTINITVTAAMAMTSSNLKLQVSLGESAIHFSAPTGTNGEKDFHHVMRKMIPNASGTALAASWTNAQSQVFTLKAKIPTYIHDKSQIEIVAFVEDQGAGATSRRVHNAAYSAPQALTLDASVMGINNALVTCNTVITPATTITNMGSATLTQCVINYKLDAGTVNTYTWTGSLATGATANVNLPAFAATTAGTHTITISTSAPNGGTDLNTANDQKVTKVVVQGTPAGTPVTEGFVSATFPPTNWVLYNPDNGAYTWKRSAAYGGYQTSTNSATIGFYNNASDGDIDELFLPITDLTAITSPSIKWDYAYNYYSDSNGDIYDSLAVLLSTDCGSTWNTIYLDGGPGLTTATTPGNSNSYTPTSTEWQTQTFSLGAYSTANSVLIKFQARNHYGNNLYVDNVNLTAATGIKTANGNINFVGVYPNPASSQTNIKVSLATSDKVSVNIFNNMGQQVFVKGYDLSSGDNVLSVSTESLASGIYTVVVNSANGTFKTKLSIAK